MSDQQAPELEDVLIRFDQEWLVTGAPALEKFAHELPAAERREGLAELVKIDLEYRWRRGVGGAALLEEYALRFADLAVGAQLIAWEYRVRRLWGDRPRHDEYLRRFPGHAAGLSAVLHRVDGELAEEFEAATAVSSTPTVADLLEQIRHLKLLSLNQLNELRRGLVQEELTSPRELARVLAERGWFTPFQIDKLVSGQAGALNLGPYLLLDSLGQGGVGQVFKARHQRMDRVVALKVIRSEHLRDPEMVARFYREIELTARLEHPNLVHAFDAGPLGSLHVLIMEYVEGRDLAALVKDEGPLPIDRACNYVRQVAAGLQYIHERNLVHRDIKPSNLVLTKQGQVKILDLGLARFRRAEGDTAADGASLPDTLTNPGAVVMMGTPDYMPPEQILDFHGADIRADIYALGCTFFFMLTGRPPFEGGTVSQKLVRQQQEDPPALEQFRQDGDDILTVVLGRMLAKRPKDRYQTPAELLTDLDWLERGLSKEAAAPPPAAPRRADPSSAQLRRGAVGGLIALAACILLALFWPWGPEAEEVPAPPKGNIDEPAPPTKQIVKAEEKTKAKTADWLLLTDKVALIRGPLKTAPPGLEAILGETRPGHELRCIAFSPDGLTLAAGSKDGTVKLWNLAAAAAGSTLGTPGKAVTALAFRKDGLLAAGSEDGLVKVWNLKNGQAVGKPLAHNAVLTQLTFSPDGNALASGCLDGRVRVWQFPSGVLSHVFKEHNALISALSYSGDGDRLAASDWDRTTVVFQFAKDIKREVRPTRLPSHPFNVAAFAPVGTTLFIGGSDGKTSLLEAWDLAKKKKPRPLANWNGVVGNLSLRKDGKLMAVSNNLGFTGTVSLRETDEGKERSVLAFGCRIIQVQFSPPGDRLAVNHGNGLVSVLRVQLP